MKKEIFLNLIFIILISILGFIQNKYFIQYMGIEVLGMMKLFSQLLAYLNIIEMGIGGASAYALYKPLVEKDYKKLSIIIGTMESIYNKIGITLFVLGLFCIPLIPFFIENTILSKKVYFYWLLYVFNTAITYLFIKYIILFTANQENLYVKKVQTGVAIFFKLLQIGLIIKYHSFFLYIILLILDNLLQWKIFRIHYKKKYSYIVKTTEKFARIKNDIKNLFWHKIGGLIVFNTDLLLISKFSSLEIVGIYASYQMVLQIISMLINVCKGVLTPKIGKYIAEHSQIEAYKFFKQLNIFYCFIATFFTYCTYFLINDFIILWIGKQFILTNYTLRLICFNLWINLFRWNLEMFKTGFGFFDDIFSPIMESIINLLTSIILGLKFGLDGILMGTIISNIIVILIYKPIIVFKRCFNLEIKFYIKIYGKDLISALFSIYFLNMATKIFIKNEIITWFDWIEKSIKVSILSLIIIVLIFMINSEFRNLMTKNIKIVLKNKINIK